jgi:hypothetical protein
MHARRWLVLSIAFTLCIASSAATAHERLPSASWCEGGTLQVVGAFDFSPGDLTAFAQCLQTGACEDTASMPAQRHAAASPTPDAAPTGPRNDSACTTRTCGEFDDDYGLGARLADRHCATFRFTPHPRSLPDEGEAIPVIVAPEVFNLRNHHRDYRRQMGLSGSCVVCRATPSPVPPSD